MSCLRDDVGSTTGAPQIADDLLQRPNRQSRATTGNRRQFCEGVGASCGYARRPCKSVMASEVIASKMTPMP